MSSIQFYLIIGSFIPFQITTRTLFSVSFLICMGFRIYLASKADDISRKNFDSRLSNDESLKPTREALNKMNEYYILAKYLDKLGIVFFILWFITILIYGTGWSPEYE